MECQGRGDLEEDPVADAVLCGPLAIVGAEPGDVIVVDILDLGRSDGRPAGSGHPGAIGCAPAPWAMSATGADTPGGLLGQVRPGLASYERVAAQAVPSADRGREMATCSIARLTPGSRVLLPVHTLGAKLSVGDLHFPESGVLDCRPAAMAGWIDLRVNLTKRGVERFQITGPILMPDPGRDAVMLRRR